MVLDRIRGFGFDTFNTILENGVRTAEIGGDFFAEIVRDKDGEFINLKPLDPSSIRIVVNLEGKVIRFEQISKTEGSDKEITKEKMFYLPRNRVADQIHGTSMIKALVEIILAKNEAMADWRRVMHHNVDPMMAYKIDSGDPKKIAGIIGKIDRAKGKGENMYFAKDTIEFEQITLAPNANLNPLPWIESLDAKFYEAAKTPKVIVGGSGGITEGATKISYLAFQQVIREKQLFIEEQVGIQLGIEIELEFPASLENELISDSAKDASNGAVQPNEVTAGRGK